MRGFEPHLGVTCGLVVRIAVSLGLVWGSWVSREAFPGMLFTAPIFAVAPRSWGGVWGGSLKNKRGLHFITGGIRMWSWIRRWLVYRSPEYRDAMVPLSRRVSEVEAENGRVSRVLMELILAAPSPCFVVSHDVLEDDKRFRGRELEWELHPESQQYVVRVVSSKAKGGST